MVMTSLCWLCYPVGTFDSWRDVQLWRGGENQFLFDFFLIKPKKLCTVITSVHNMKTLNHQYSSPLMTLLPNQYKITKIKKFLLTLLTKYENNSVKLLLI